MLGFIIPLRPKFNSKDWSKDVKLLNRTIRSILQSNAEVHIFVVYSDLPFVEKVCANVHLIKFDLPYLHYYDIEDIDAPFIKYSSSSWLEKNMDKGRKIMYGCKIAKVFGCKYMMQVDSDDLVSRKIAGFVYEQKSRNAAGWYVNKGYLYIEGKPYLLRQLSKMNYLNGSTHIIREDLIPDIDINSKRFQDFTFFSSHGYLVNRIRDYFGETLEALPFYANVYIISGNNQSEIKSIITKSSLKNLMRLLFRGIILTENIKGEFGLYKI